MTTFQSAINNSSRFDDDYLKEVSKRNIMNDLGRISKLIATLTRAFDKESELSNETKKKILILQDMISDVYDMEMKKIINKQKEEGKEFLSNKEIDNLIDSIKKELI